MTCIDGYEMAKQGRAGKALGIAAIASFVAGTIGVIGLTFLAPLAADVAVNFGPPEYSALMIFALLLVIMLAGDSMLKGFISMFIGLFLSTIGTDLFSASKSARWSDFLAKRPRPSSRPCQITGQTLTGKAPAT